MYAANAWNAFDLAYVSGPLSRAEVDAQISIFLLYLALRVFALVTHSPTTSDLAFDILACGACILFPRLVFFLIKDHVVIIAVSRTPCDCALRSSSKPWWLASLGLWGLLVGMSHAPY